MPLIKLQPNNVQLGPKPQTHNLHRHRIKVQMRQDKTIFHFITILNTCNSRLLRIFPTPSTDVGGSNISGDWRLTADTQIPLSPYLNTFVVM